MFFSRPEISIDQFWNLSGITRSFSLFSRGSTRHDTAKVAMLAHMVWLMKSQMTQSKRFVHKITINHAFNNGQLPPASCIFHSAPARPGDESLSGPCASTVRMHRVIVLAKYRIILLNIQLWCPHDSSKMTLLYHNPLTTDLLLLHYFILSLF